MYKLIVRPIPPRRVHSIQISDLRVLTHQGHSRNFPLEVSTTLTRPFSLNFGKNLSRSPSQSRSTNRSRNSTSRVCLYPDIRSRSTSPHKISSNNTQHRSRERRSHSRRELHEAKVIFLRLLEVMEEMKVCSPHFGCVIVTFSWQSSGQRERSRVGTAGKSNRSRKPRSDKYGVKAYRKTVKSVDASGCPRQQR